MADQQEEALSDRRPVDRGTDPRRRGLELARVDVMRRLQAAASGPLHEMLERALADLDDKLRRLEAESPPQE